jgi:hypothetical protein
MTSDFAGDTDLYRFGIRNGISYKLNPAIGKAITIPKVSMIEIDKRLGVLSYQNAMLLEALKRVYEQMKWVTSTEPEWGYAVNQAKRAIEMCEGGE